MQEPGSTTGKDDNAQKLERLAKAFLNETGNKETDQPGAELVNYLVQERYSGSFPHPDVLRLLNQVIPDGAERIFASMEAEQKHRHECDKILLKSQTSCSEKGASDRRLIVVLSFIFLLFCLICTMIAIMSGHTIGTVVGGGGVLVGLGTLFTVLRRFTGNDSDEKPNP